jgi:flagellar hook-associated protein 3 FlgL
MIRVADWAQFQFTMANIQRSQSTLAANQIQIATGKKAQSYSEIAPQSAELVSLERSLERGDQFVTNIDLAQGRLGVMDSTFAALQDRAINIKSLISQGLSGNNIAEVPLEQFAATFSDETASLLNTQLAGQYSFAGSLTDQPAVDLSDIDYDPQAGLPGSFAADPDYYQGDDFKHAVRADEGYEVAYGITAADPAFEQMLRALAYMDFAGATQDTAVLEEALGLIDAAIDGLSDLRGQVGAHSQALRQSKTTHEDFKAFAQNLVSNIEDVDIAQATSELAFNEVQLQGSFMTLARLQSLSLLDFL